MQGDSNIWRNPASLPEGVADKFSLYVFSTAVSMQSLHQGHFLVSARPLNFSEGKAAGQGKGMTSCKIASQAILG